MYLLLLLPAWFAAFFAFRKMSWDWREAAFAASIVWGSLVVMLTEGLSLFQALAFAPLIVAWGLISCISIGICLRLWPHISLSKEQFARVSRKEMGVPALLIIGMSIILLATLVVALSAPPNTWDSMTYHMARVANWVDHRSVRHYPTAIPRQLYLGPWAEFAITQLQILTGGDRFANCVQYVSMLGSVAGVSLLAKKLGASFRGQLFASVFCATIPMGILQASSTQTDYVTSFWFLCFLNFTIGMIDPASPRPRENAALAGLSLGLAALTKMTVPILALPFLLWGTIALIWKRRRGDMCVLGIVAAVALAINAGHIIRNERTFGWPIGPRAESATYANEIHTPGAIASNVIRNVAVHIGMPPGEEGIVGQTILAFISQIHSLTGFDINDRRTTFLDTRFGYSLSLSMNEDTAGNPLHLLLAGFAVIVVLWGFRRNRAAAIYSACLVGAFLLFCGYLRWQPWISRLHLPLFVAVSPVFGLFWSRDIFRRVAPAVAVLLIFVGTIYAIAGKPRPLVGEGTILQRSRTALYFANRSDILGPFSSAAAAVARGGPSKVGIISGVDDWEYPLRLLVRERLGDDVQFEHVNVQNLSRNCLPDIPSDRGSPEKIVVIGSFDPHGIPAGYTSVYDSASIRVFQR